MKKWIIQEVDVPESVDETALVYIRLWDREQGWITGGSVTLIDPARIKQLDYIIEPED